MFFLPSIFAFGITNLWMLGWLAAAGVPILIHLWNRQKYREMPWAAMQYLLAAIKKQTRRMRFEQLLLLVIRMLIIVLLVLAVAEPFLERIGFASTSAGRTHRVLVIDGSFSMGYIPAEKSHFERAKQLARQIVEENRQGDASTLVLMASPPRVVVGTPALEPGEMLEEIDNLQRPDTTADLPATLPMIQQVIENAGRDNPGLMRHEVYFLTDLQRVGWTPELSAAALAGFRKRSRELAESATLVVIDLGQPGAENVALTGLRCLEPVAGLAQNVNLEAALRNFGRQARPRQPVELLVDGRRVDRKQVAIAPEGEAVAAFSYRFEIPGDHTIEVRADGDALQVDNHRWMAIPVRQSIRVLCINGRPSGEPFGGATDWLFYALSPRSSQAEQGLVQAEVATESALRQRDLGQYDCVFLCDVAQFTSGEARVLDAYLTHRGNLVIFLGEQVLPDRYNRELGGGAGGVRLLPAELGTVVDQPVFDLDPLDYRHPIVRAFRRHEKAGLLTTPIYKYFKLTLPKNSRANVVLRTDSGDPLIVEEPIHRGRVVLVATSADARWTDMPAYHSYVPIVQELLAYCVGGQRKQRNVEVGQSIGGSISTPATDLPLEVQGPVGPATRVPLRSDGDYCTWSHADTLASGIYTARFGPPVGRQSFAVNVDTVESDLAKLTEEQLRGEVWPEVPFLYQTKWQNVGQPPAGSITPQSRLHVDLLYAVLVLLFVETFLAWRFAHHPT